MPFTNVPAIAPVRPEWEGKAILRAIGVKTPAGGLVRTPTEATEIASRMAIPSML